MKWLMLVSYFGVGWAWVSMGECHQAGWLSALLQMGAVVALGVTLVHYWKLIEEAEKMKHWDSPLWDPHISSPFYDWAEFMPEDRLRGMLQTIEAILAGRERRGS